MPKDPSDREKPTSVGQTPIYRVERPAVLTLRQLRGPGAPRDVPLDADSIILGRGNEANVQIDSDSVSRRHVAILRSKEGYTVADLRSSNGVYVNSRKVEASELRAGDSLQIGDALFVIVG
jgi:pSer/pThr/pTyr-binding forkhead associated (FHA) protein